jgi:ribosomal protein L22
MATKKASKKATTRKRQLSPRQARAVQNRLAGMSCRAALINAGYPESTAEKSAAAVFSRLGGVLAAEFEKHGLTTEALAKQIIEGTQATKDNGQPDHYARHSYHKLIVSIRGDLAPKKFEHSGGVEVSIEDRRKEQQGVWERLGGIS